MKTPYETLDIKKTDSKDKIKKAYRKKSMKAHPDQGGSSEEFDTINKAYRILVDDNKRARLDNGEDADDILKSTQSKEQRSISILVQMFTNIVSSNDPDTSNIIKLMTGQLKTALANLDTMTKDENAKKKKFEIAIKRLKNKGKNNLFKEAALSQISSIEKNIEQVKASKNDFSDALKFLEDFSYEIEEMPANSFINLGNIFTTGTTSAWG